MTSDITYAIGLIMRYIWWRQYVLCCTVIFQFILWVNS